LESFIGTKAFSERICRNIISAAENFCEKGGGRKYKVSRD